MLSEPDAHGDLRLLKVTSKSHYEPCVVVAAGDLASGDLKQTSYIRIDHAIAAHVSLLRSTDVRLKPEKLAEVHRALALASTRQYSRLRHAQYLPASDPQRKPWQAGDTIPYAGRVFGEEEVEAAVASSLDFWLTLGAEGDAFERELAAYLGVRSSLLVNSGSSANLIALSTLTSPLIEPERRLRPGDEVITCAAGFPTTVAPILQNGCVAVFVDADPITANLRVEQLEAAHRPGKTKAVMLAHGLGNPFNIAAVLGFCRRHGLWLIEDNCDALGSTYSMPRPLAESLGHSENSPGLDEGPDRVVRYTGTWGDLSTQSFYPPHHITMGEGGAVNVVSGNGRLRRIVESLRDWGRDCWCPSGRDDSCGKRYGWQLGELPPGYDHKYIYSHLGYNLKPLDLQAAIGRVQLRRLPGFVEARKRNWLLLRRELEPLAHLFGFGLPTHATGLDPESGDVQWDESGCRSDCSWFGFLLLVRPEAPFTNSELGRHLAAGGIGSRMLFGGNLLRQPAFVQLRQDRPEALRVVAEEMEGADGLMERALFLGTYPGLEPSMLERQLALIRNLITSPPTPQTERSGASL
ncbi:lipopolysaccharide biosynthesis protein RfbH [Cyanobium sp. Morenito 9A2]|uniref:lipopolysaccharide biosynthesis protein RfbH n=1 Tax=Cyanobium sp. Morenito 9A2 TaxID=2823718 RepID=UPI0020CEFEF3|nr:lipopolysaccharide biosynthesis protein RfbH [Cyanobium sp. Morenito 9A2]